MQPVASTMMLPLLLLALPLDVLVCALGLMDAADLMRLRAADPQMFDRTTAELMLAGRPFTYAARRILTTHEIAWFECRGISVQLLVEHSVYAHAEYWYQNGLRHRDGDQPAAVWAAGDQFWYKNGKCHRDGDQPAEIWADGTQKWYQFGKLRRDDDLPVVILASGTQMWIRAGCGMSHRDCDMPAIVRTDGSQEWYQFGKLHRDDDLPAIIRGDGTQFWYQNGKLQMRN